MHYEIGIANNGLWCGLQWLTVAYNDDLPESITPNMYVVRGGSAGKTAKKWDDLR